MTELWDSVALLGSETLRKDETVHRGRVHQFPRQRLVPNSETPEGRNALLRYYYAGNLELVIAIKRKYDPENFFNFQMGIPTQ
jgi:hypothetical protein